MGRTSFDSLIAKLLTVPSLRSTNATVTTKTPQGADGPRGHEPRLAFDLRLTDRQDFRTFRGCRTQPPRSINLASANPRYRIGCGLWGPSFKPATTTGA